TDALSLLRSEHDPHRDNAAQIPAGLSGLLAGSGPATDCSGQTGRLSGATLSGTS
nr:hypothetical protein [Tanacetum cinerariifolium]